jgi:TonB family protein
MVEAARPWRTSVRRRRKLGRVTVISLWLHLTLLALLMVAAHYAPPQEEELPPPSTVAMVFEGGSKNGPSVPNPKPNVLEPSPRAAPPPVPRPPPQARAAPPPPTPAPPAAVQPAPAPSPPAPPAPPPPAPTAELPLPPPPPPVAMVMPRPVLPRPAPARPPSNEPRPAPRNPDAFPAPMNFSFNRPMPQEERPVTRTSSRAPVTLDFSLAPRAGATNNSPFARIAGAHDTEDWRNQLSAWVHEHAYYPEQAAMNGEDGNVMVQVSANPDGRVTSVQLESRSGSQWLDMALMGLFRDAHLPPLHEDEPITFNFTMHYILIRE